MRSEISWIGNLQRDFFEAGKVVGAFLQKQEAFPTIQQLSIDTSSIKFKLERMRMPMCNGNIRDYSPFKTEFIKQLQSKIQKKERAAYTLKSCLTDILYQLVKNVDDDLEELWKRLNDRYGRTSKLKESIMYNIKRTNPIKECEEKKLVEFVDFIERTHHDLADKKIERELSNTTVISLLEEKFPKNIRRVWPKKVNEKDSK